jgi:ribonuclease HI
MTEPRPAIIIYTDGACDPNPGPGGWAALILNGKQRTPLTGCEAHTTNNRMELTAAVQALQSLPQPSQVTLITDSTYVMRGITEWLPNWIKRNWRGSSGPVANQDLWQELVKAAARHTIQWQWTRGHAGSLYNNQVDRLARAAIRGTLPPGK